MRLKVSAGLHDCSTHLLKLGACGMNALVETLLGSEVVGQQRCIMLDMHGDGRRFRRGRRAGVVVGGHVCRWSVCGTSPKVGREAQRKSERFVQPQRCRHFILQVDSCVLQNGSRFSCEACYWSAPQAVAQSPLPLPSELSTANDRIPLAPVVFSFLFLNSQTHHLSVRQKYLSSSAPSKMLEHFCFIHLFAIK